MVIIAIIIGCVLGVIVRKTCSNNIVCLFWIFSNSNNCSIGFGFWRNSISIKR